jgi:hypothetical protein
MKINELVGYLDAGLNEARIEVVVSERNGRKMVVLQLSTWHETLGWQAQKTIPFAVEKIGQLQRLLSQTRNHIEDRTISVGSAAKVIEFAVPRSSTQFTRLVTQPHTQTDDQLAGAVS